MRRSVVLPDPEGPSNASNSPDWMSRLTSPSAVKVPKRLVALRTEMRIGLVLADFGFERDFREQRHEREQRQQRRDRERRHELIFVVENFDVQRHGVGLAADM